MSGRGLSSDGSAHCGADRCAAAGHDRARLWPRSYNWVVWRDLSNPQFGLVEWRASRNGGLVRNIGVGGWSYGRIWVMAEI